MWNTFFLGAASSIVATIIIKTVIHLFRYLKTSRIKSKFDITGKWFMYRLDSGKHQTPYLEINISFHKGFWRGRYFEFFSKYINAGKITGKVVFTGGVISCIYQGSPKEEPFMITIDNHGRLDANDFRVGVISGVGYGSGTLYCSKILLSKVKISEKQLSSHLNKSSSIKVKTDFPSLLELAKSIE